MVVVMSMEQQGCSNDGDGSSYEGMVVVARRWENLRAWCEGFSVSGEGYGTS